MSAMLEPVGPTWMQGGLPASSHVSFCSPATFKQKPAPVSGAGLLPEAELNTCPQRQGRLDMLKIRLTGQV
jgi:hypothetical protein